MSPPNDRGITGLRGYASLMVLGYHIGEALAIPSGLWLFLGWGYSGVDLFFVVSGYLLTLKFLRGDYQIAGRFSKTRYYLRRVFRIWPLYWVALPLFILLVQYPATPLDLFFGQDYLRATFAYAPPWTLCVEELFYAVLPLWALAYRSRHWPALTLALFGVSLAWRFYATAPSSDLFLMAQFPSYAFSYGLGSAAARGLRLRMPKIAAWGLALGALPLFVVWQNTFVQPTLAAAVFFVVLTELKGSAIFAGKIGQAVGRLTYPVYLFGLPIQRGLQTTSAASWVWAPLTVALTLGTAYAAARWLERPCIEVGRRIERRLISGRTKDSSQSPPVPSASDP
jgi:peptidoglycan/LPS O-acetylase OafA/YrhL